jgi:hypothetical protein
MVVEGQALQTYGCSSAADKEVDTPADLMAWMTAELKSSAIS